MEKWKGESPGHQHEGAQPLEHRMGTRATVAFLSMNQVQPHEQIPTGGGKMPNKYRRGTESDAQVCKSDFELRCERKEI